MSKQATEKKKRSEDDRAYLVVVDETPESLVALRYGALLAKRADAELTLLMILESAPAFRQWLGVETLMQEEARQEAEAMMRRMAGEVKDYASLTAEIVLREGDKVEALKAHIAEKRHVNTLVLGAAGEGDPGPLVNHVALGAFDIPVIIVPGHLTAAEIRKLV